MMFLTSGDTHLSAFSRRPFHVVDVCAIGKIQLFILTQHILLATHQKDIARFIVPKRSLRIFHEKMISVIISLLRYCRSRIPVGVKVFLFVIPYLVSPPTAFSAYPKTPYKTLSLMRARCSSRLLTFSGSNGWSKSYKAFWAACIADCTELPRIFLQSSPQ